MKKYSLNKIKKEIFYSKQNKMKITMNFYQMNFQKFFKKNLIYKEFMLEMLKMLILMID